MSETDMSPFRPRSTVPAAGFYCYEPETDENLLIGIMADNQSGMEQLQEECSQNLNRLLLKARAEAWREGHRAAWEESGEGWNGEVNGVCRDYDELLRCGMFEDNPYESEES
ncbi:hypothetical protein [Bifidobacterium sp.]|uniref:hypothetical protein n=1 Tax=Bifidobacterium sp. TaxID=41200 RepID=UPI0039E9E548